MKILFVENHAAFAQVAVRQFLGADQVTVAASLVEARAALASGGRFDAALVDFDLDDGKGDVFVAELRRSGFTGKIVATSAHEAGNDALIRAGATVRCPKARFAELTGLLRATPSSLEWWCQTLPQRPPGADVVEAFSLGAATVFVVNDGAGGTGGGLAAARLVAAQVRAEAPSIDPFDARAWCGLLSRADTALAARNEGRTTALVCACDGERVVGASAGDGEAWLIGAELRVLTEKQHRKPLLGQGGVEPVGFEATLAHSVLLLGSDGLFKYAPLELILETARSEDPIEERGARMIQLPRLTSGALPDDVAVALVRRQRG